ncbi:energy transducer TonB [Flavobacterium daemonense]|uniref:hypothetical protein n=1 Tax=Flavobacterium daemonense TaxID=1393049 RepID=UPI001186361E|nr:hypothetical protein [Flavobacterium daemonense]KAF2337008.1 hypothetical protein FND99_00970 [Flavobacterium daemonense]
MKELLSKFSIGLDSILISCAHPPKGFRRYCYAERMNLEIEKKFGDKFIDSLRNVADQQFVKNNPNLIFDFSECETTSRYITAKTYEEFLEKPENDFIDGLNYPKMSKRQAKKEKANTEVFFVIYKDGSVGNLKAESDFSISKNKDFAKYFEKEATSFVKKAKWKPANYRGIIVNSEMTLNLYNK